MHLSGVSICLAVRVYLIVHITFGFGLWLISKSICNHFEILHWFDFIEDIKNTGFWGVSAMNWYEIKLHIGWHFMALNLYLLCLLKHLVCIFSVQVWQCGGSMEVLPCARVAHIERTKKPYNNDIDYYAKRNALRAAEVWMDEYKSHVYMAWNIPMNVGLFPRFNHVLPAPLTLCLSHLRPPDLQPQALHQSTKIQHSDFIPLDLLTCSRAKAQQRGSMFSNTGMKEMSFLSNQFIFIHITLA